MRKIKPYWYDNMDMKKIGHMDCKMQVSLTLDYELVQELDRLRKREPKSTYINYLLREAVGLGNENSGVEA